MAERVPDILAELVRTKVDVIVIDAPSLAHAGHLTASVPMVFVIADDPVAAGYVASLARPAGRMTGLTSLNLGLDAKRLEILKLALPSVTRVGVLSVSNDRTRRERLMAIEHGARAVGVQLVILDLPSDDKLSQAFSAASRARIGAVIELGQPLLFGLQRDLVGLSDKARVPVISAWREFPEAGGLMSYGTRVTEMFRRAASYVDRILKGSDPADLPVEQASTFELVINLKTAKAFGLTIPPSLLLRADEVIQ
jgi:putative ABC transport system substrate-binding protein